MFKDKCPYCGRMISVTQEGVFYPHKNRRIGIPCLRATVRVK